MLRLCNQRELLTSGASPASVVVAAFLSLILLTLTLIAAALVACLSWIS